MGKKTCSHGLILFAPSVALMTQGKKSLHLSPTASQVNLNIAKGTTEPGIDWLKKINKFGLVRIDRFNVEGLVW